MHDEWILRTQGLSKRFGTRWAVRDLNLRIRAGEIFGFLGPNGAGKSTTIRMLLSLIRPTEGEVELFGLPLSGQRRDILARVGGLVERADFYLYLSARRNLDMVAALIGGVPRAAIEEVLASVGLADRADDPVKTFSHGMKQRLGIAQALLGSPEFVILDEPTSGLDPQGIKEVRDLIRRLSAERRLTIFLSSHLLSEIEQVATSMAIINAGSLVVQGSVADLLNSGDHHVRLQVRPVDRAIEVIRTWGYDHPIEPKGDTVELAIAAQRTASLNAALVRGGVEVDALVPRRSLEEYFLSITEGASDVRPRPDRGFSGSAQT